MTFARLTRGDWLAAVAALALLLVMAADWYSTEAGEQARKDAEQAESRGPVSGQVARQVDEDAEIIRARAEKNAWQAEPFADRLVLVALLAALLLAIAAAWLRAADRRFRPPWTPSTLATGAGLAALILLAARIIQKPAADAGAVVKPGAIAGLVCVGAITLGARFAWNAERDGSAWEERPAGGDPTEQRPDADRDDEDTAEREALTGPGTLFDHAEAAPDGAATATIAPAPPAEEQPTDEPPPALPAPGQPQLDAPADAAWAPDWDDPEAAERERRRAERAQRRGGSRAKKRRRRR